MRRHALPLALALSLSLVAPATCAVANETEITGGFVPVIEVADAPSSTGDSSSSAEEPAGGAETPSPDAGSSGSGEESASGSATDPASGDAKGSGGAASAGGSGEETDLSDDAGTAATGAETSEGIPLLDGSVITVDGRAALVVVRPSGESQVIDDGRAYVLEVRPGGEARIGDDAGNEVRVKGSVVRYVDATGAEAEVDVGELVGEEPAEAELELSDESAPSRGSGDMVAACVAAGAIAIAIAGVLVWRRRSGDA